MTTASTTTTVYDSLHDLIRARMDELRIPGVALGILLDGEEHTAGFGVTNINHPLDVDAQTLFQIGSITKTFVGTAVMKLVEQGRLSLDTPVQEWLPDFRVQDDATSTQVTMRHLLTHTSGWVGDYFDQTGDGDDALEQVVTRMAQLPQLTPIDGHWAYNNSGFYVAGRIIEVITGQTFEDAMDELVLQPLGMSHTFLHPTDVMVHRFAAGHDVSSTDEVVVAEPWPLTRCANPAGGITSSIDDLLRYARFQLANGQTADGTHLLTDASITAMRTPHTAVDTLGNHVGITWMIRHIGDQRLYTHSGGTNGQISLFAVAPDHQFACVIVTNADRGGELTGPVLAHAFDALLGVRASGAKATQRSADDLAAYAGDYHGTLSDLRLRVNDEGTLMLQSIPKGGFPLPDSPARPASSEMRVGWHGADQIEVLDAPFTGTRGDFLRTADGAIDWLRLGSRLARRQS